MTYCQNCGTAVDGKYCAKCGAPVAPEQADFANPSPAVAASGGLSDNLASALCYSLGLITGILFLVLEPYKRSKSVRFHAFQAIFFHVALIVLSVVLGMFAVMMPFELGYLSRMLSTLISLGGIVLWLVLMYKAYQRQQFELPLIGDLARKQV